MHCALCKQGVAAIVGGNGLCEDHLEEARSMTHPLEMVGPEDTPEPRQVEEPEPISLRHNPFDPNCVKHRPSHPTRPGAQCERCLPEET